MLNYFVKLNRGYRRYRPFSDREAWALFRAAAIAEAIGWTLLIIGIACKQLPFGWHEIPVAIAGRIHGIFFIAYIMAALAFGSSLGWSIPKTLVAGLFSVPPYGSMVFEQWEAKRRASVRARRIYRTVWYWRLADARPAKI